MEYPFDTGDRRADRHHDGVNPLLDTRIAHFGNTEQFDPVSQFRSKGDIDCWGGGGIVADSQWQQEYQEAYDKVGKLFKALEGL